MKVRYKTAKLDSARASLDRKVSFNAYAHDNYFGIANEGETENDFQLDHYYDEPSPELFKELSGDFRLGVRRPRAFSNVSNADVESRASRVSRKSFMMPRRGSVMIPKRHPPDDTPHVRPNKNFRERLQSI